MIKAQMSLVALLLKGAKSGQYIRLDAIPGSEPERYRISFTLQNELNAAKDGCDVWDFIEFSRIMAKATLSETKDPKLLYALKFLEKALKFGPAEKPKKSKKAV